MAEFSLGALRTIPRVTRNFVGYNDTQDTFSFSLNETSNINLALTGLMADAGVTLYRDDNNNGVIDSTDTYIAGSFLAGQNDESINLESQMAGNYLVEVSQFSGNTRYNLRLSSTSPQSPSNLLPTEAEVGSLSGTQTFYDDVGENDTSDVYHFVLNSDGNFSLSLTGLSSDADVRLIQDSNSNLRVDRGEEIAISGLGSTSSESISQYLSAGDYFVQVYQYTPNTSFNSYNLSLTASTFTIDYGYYGYE